MKGRIFSKDYLLGAQCILSGVSDTCATAYRSVRCFHSLGSANIFGIDFGGEKSKSFVLQLLLSNTESFSASKSTTMSSQHVLQQDQDYLKNYQTLPRRRRKKYISPSTSSPASLPGNDFFTATAAVTVAEARRKSPSTSQLVTLRQHATDYSNGHTELLSSRKSPSTSASALPMYTTNTVITFGAQQVSLALPLWLLAD